MARSILLTLGTPLGATLGPDFNLTADYGLVIPSTATTIELITGKVVLVDDLATNVTITSTGVCTNAITQNIPCAGTTTTTSTTSTTSTSTTSTTSTSTTTTFGPLSIEYLIVAGGGSGGGKSTEVGTLYDDVWPGGGGGGQVISGSITNTSQLIVGVGEGGQNTFYYNNGTLLPGHGTGSYYSGSHGSKGFPSYISGSAIYETAIGGGQGGTTDWYLGGNPIPVQLFSNSTFTGVHCNGGNGGGAALVSGGLATYTTFSGGTPAAGGFYGASSTGSIGSPFNYGNTAGGGAGASQNAIGGNGGSGSLWLDGARYAGGGAGFIRKVSTTPAPSVYETGQGGPGGGGGYNTDGTINTGGGGGGSRDADYPANGGKGIVKIRYAGATVKATGGTITQSGGYTYHTFTSSLSGGVYIVGAVSSSIGITGGTYMYETPFSGSSAFSASFVPL